MRGDARTAAKRFLLARGWTIDRRAVPNVAGQLAKFRAPHAPHRLRSLRNALAAERRRATRSAARSVPGPICRTTTVGRGLSALSGLFLLRRIRSAQS